jgi:hypothetical protein
LPTANPDWCLETQVLQKRSNNRSLQLPCKLMTLAGKNWISLLLGGSKWLSLAAWSGLSFCMNRLTTISTLVPSDQNPPVLLEGHYPKLVVDLACWFDQTFWMTKKLYLLMQSTSSPPWMVVLIQASVTYR